MEKWADKNAKGKEGLLVANFAAMAAQTKPNIKETRPSSILAHDLEPVLSPSRELAKKFRYHLDVGLGKKVVQSPRSVAFEGGFGGGTTHNTGSSVVRKR